MKTGIELIREERNRQIMAEGYSELHDDKHKREELVNAAISYAYATNENFRQHCLWPWEKEAWKPKDRKSNLIKAGALIAAELDRIQRSEIK